MHRKFIRLAFIFVTVVAVTGFTLGVGPLLGVFDGNSDVGAPQHAGTAVFDLNQKVYTITGGGANMWATNDAFHFVWKKVTDDDVSLEADMKLTDADGDPHRKACLMLRQSMDADSVYADAALHGNGLIALQYRDAKGVITHGTNSPVKGPVQLGIEKHGSTISMNIAGTDGKLAPSGLTCNVTLQTPYYVGLAVCAHNDKTLRTATFSNVVLSTNK